MRALTAVLLVLGSAPAHAAPRTAGTKSYSFPIPDGYDDVTRELDRQGEGGETVAVKARRSDTGYPTTILVQKARAQAHVADMASCTAVGKTIAAAVKGTLRSATMVMGPLGSACQMNLVAPQGVAIITELDAPHATWLMTCNHADGDMAAEKVCQDTVAGFKLR